MRWSLPTAVVVCVAVLPNRLEHARPLAMAVRRDMWDTYQQRSALSLSLSPPLSSFPSLSLSPSPSPSQSLWQVWWGASCPQAGGVLSLQNSSRQLHGEEEEGEGGHPQSECCWHVCMTVTLSVCVCVCVCVCSCRVCVTANWRRRNHFSCPTDGCPSGRASLTAPHSVYTQHRARSHNVCRKRDSLPPLPLCSGGSPWSSPQL